MKNIELLNKKKYNNFLLWENNTCDSYYQPCFKNAFYNNGYFYPI